MNIKIGKTKGVKFDATDISALRKGEILFEAFNLTPTLELNIEAIVGEPGIQSSLSFAANKILFLISHNDFNKMVSESDIKKGISIGEYTLQVILPRKNGHVFMRLKDV